METGAKRINDAGTVLDDISKNTNDTIRQIGNNVDQVKGPPSLAHFCPHFPNGDPSNSAFFYTCFHHERIEHTVFMAAFPAVPLVVRYFLRDSSSFTFSINAFCLSVS
jgi:hypothetical protein